MQSSFAMVNLWNTSSLMATTSTLDLCGPQEVLVWYLIVYHEEKGKVTVIDRHFF